MADRTPAPGEAEGQQRDKTRRVADAFTVAKIRAAGQPVVVGTRHGQVVLTDVTYTDHDGVPCVENTVGGGNGQPPHFRVFNPPILATDPAGAVTVGTRRYREDPVAALAELIARHRPDGRPRR
jgi:hypothetical protein